MSDKPALNLCKVGKIYATRGETLHVLDDISLTLERGRSAVIMGRSGSGKSTLLNIIGSLDTPSGGTVEVEGVNPFALSERELASFRNRQIGFVFQDHHVLPQCTVLENVLLPALADRAAPDRGPRARELLDRVGLADRMTHFPAEISGGQRQRVAIARALINQPGLVLADEPTGNLDHAAAEGVADLLASLARDEHAALVVVTHDGDFARRFDRVYRLEDGRLQDERQPA